MLRRNFLGSMIAGAVAARAQQQRVPFIEGPANGQPHKGKVLLAVQAHSDDIPLSAAVTVVCWDPWAYDEENPDHYMTARALEAACWMAGRAHDYPEQFAAGLAPKTVQDKYYFARRPEITRVVDITK